MCRRLQSLFKVVNQKFMLTKVGSEVLSQEQLDDKDIGPFIRWKINGMGPTCKEISAISPVIKGYWAIRDSIVIDDGIIKRSSDGKTYLQIIPNRKHWKGSYSVNRKISDVVYRIQKYPQKKIKVVHRDDRS